MIWVKILQIQFPLPHLYFILGYLSDQILIEHYHLGLFLGRHLHCVGDRARINRMERHRIVPWLLREREGFLVLVRLQELAEIAGQGLRLVGLRSRPDGFWVDVEAIVRDYLLVVLA